MHGAAQHPNAGVEFMTWAVTGFEVLIGWLAAPPACGAARPEKAVRRREVEQGTPLCCDAGHESVVTRPAVRPSGPYGPRAVLTAWCSTAPQHRCIDHDPGGVSRTLHVLWCRRLPRSGHRPTGPVVMPAACCNQRRPCGGEPCTIKIAACKVSRGLRWSGHHADPRSWYDAISMPWTLWRRLHHEKCRVQAQLRPAMVRSPGPRLWSGATSMTHSTSSLWRSLHHHCSSRVCCWPCPWMRAPFEAIFTRHEAPSSCSTVVTEGVRPSWAKRVWC